MGDSWPYRKKYHPGEPFEDMNALFAWLSANRWVMLRKVPKHPSIIRNMCISTVMGFMARGSITRAVRTNENIDRAIHAAGEKLAFLPGDGLTEKDLRKYWELLEGIIDGP